MKKNFYIIALVLLGVCLSHITSAQFDVLFLGNTDDNSAVTTVDAALIEYLGLEGYTVTFVSSTDYKAGGSGYETAETYAGYDVLFISESIGSSDANNFLTAGFPIPCVATEGFVLKQGRWGILADDGDTYFKQASSATLTADALTLEITDIGHWITMDYTENYPLAWAEIDDPTKVGVTAFNLSDDVPGAVPLGSFVFDMGGLPSLWAVPEGSLWNETALPNMVFIGVIQTDVGQVFTGEFQELLVKCIRWATDDYEPISVNDPQQEGLLPGPNPTTGLVHVSLTLPEAGNVTVHIYDMTGRLMSTADQGYLAAGENTLQFDISELPDAQYIYEVLTSSEVLTGKLIKE